MGDAVHHVGGAGAAGRHADAGTAGDVAPGCGEHRAGDLLLHQQEPHLALACRLHQLDRLAAGMPDDERRPRLLECARHHLDGRGHLASPDFVLWRERSTGRWPQRMPFHVIAGLDRLDRRSRSEGRRHPPCLYRLGPHTVGVCRRLPAMNAMLRNRCDHARRVGFRIAVARVRIQAEVMTSRAPLAVPTPGFDVESAGDREISMRAISMWSDHGASGRGALVEIPFPAKDPVVDRS